MSNFDTLADRIREEAAQAARPGQMERLEGIAEDVEALRRGAKTLGQTIEQQCRMVLDATGLHHFIGEDGDGDWGAVWDNLYEIRANAIREAFRRFSEAIETELSHEHCPTLHGSKVIYGDVLLRQLRRYAETVHAATPTPTEAQDAPDEES